MVQVTLVTGGAAGGNVNHFAAFSRDVSTWLAPAPNETAAATVWQPHPCACGPGWHRPVRRWRRSAHPGVCRSPATHITTLPCNQVRTLPCCQPPVQHTMLSRPQLQHPISDAALIAHCSVSHAALVQPTQRPTALCQDKTTVVPASPCLHTAGFLEAPLVLLAYAREVPGFQGGATSWCIRALYGGESVCPQRMAV